ncbi:MAG: hemolysin family protein [Treponema sp.]
MENAEFSGILVLLGTLILLFLLSMFFSSAETAFLSLNTLRLRLLQEQQYAAAVQAAKVLHNKQKFLSAILIGNSIVNIAISAVLTAAALALFGDSGLAVAVGAGTVLVLIFGEIVPKSIALVYPDTLSFAFARLILFFMAVMSPVVYCFYVITDALLHLCGITVQKSAAAVTEADLKDFFAEREEDGIIESEGRALLNRILQYGDFSAKTIMTPRRSIIAVQTGTPLDTIIALAKDSHYSRLPVYSSDIDNIIGVFYLKDYVCSPNYPDNAEQLHFEHYIRKPLFVFETTKLSEIERKLHQEKQNMAIVLDEYGGTAGLITGEDLHEEIFGSLFDEYDTVENSKNISDPAPYEAYNETVLDGTERLTVVNEQFGLNLHSDYYDTIGGYLMEKAGEIPECGFALSIPPYTFTVAAINAQRITSVKVRVT